MTCLQGICKIVRHWIVSEHQIFLCVLLKCIPCIAESAGNNVNCALVYISSFQKKLPSYFWTRKEVLNMRRFPLLVQRVAVPMLGDRTQESRCGGLALTS